jgi:pimeloyl-ACP methyl ester carboxylesterase
MADSALTAENIHFRFSPDDTINCLVCGSGPRHILFLHGFAASQHTWDDLAALFPADDYTLHLLDLKGHGGSSKPAGGDYSARYNARIVTAYIRSRWLEDVTLIGHSFGGLIGLIASLESSAISRLVLIGCPGFPQTIPRFMRLLRIPFLGPLFMTLVPARRIARKGLESVFYRHERITERLVERYAASYRGLAAARALAQTVRQMIPQDVGQISDRYEGIAIPVLILRGEHDRIIKAWQGDELQRLISGSRLVTIAGCGHNPHEELPEETFVFVREFLAEGAVDKPGLTC